MENMGQYVTVPGMILMLKSSVLSWDTQWKVRNHLYHCLTLELIDKSNRNSRISIGVITNICACNLHPQS